MIFDPMYLILVMLPGLILGLWAQARVRSAYSKASKIRPASGLTGAQAAAEIMEAEGITDVRIEPVRGWLSDHYDPRHKVLRLSPEVHSGQSLAALGIAAHEVGHAIQDARRYRPLVLRNAIVPMAAVGTNLGLILVIIGVLLSRAADYGIGIAIAGLILFALTVVFQIINLPVEFDASARARERLLALGMVTDSEAGVVKNVLSAAALTYVAALVTAILNLLYYAMLVANASRR